MLARMAIARSPRSSSTAAPVSKSVATARNGVGSSIEVRAVAERQGELTQRLLQLLALDESLRQQDLAVLQTQRQAHQEIAVVLFAPEGEITARRRVAEGFLPIERAHGVGDLATVIPLAYRPPTTAPMLVPAMQSIGTFSSSRTLSTPMCAMPRAPPPDNTKQMRGRIKFCSGEGSGPADGVAAARAAPPAFHTQLAISAHANPARERRFPIGEIV
jgi:hypothetical protein